MAAITDGIGSGVGSAGVGRRDSIGSSSPVRSGRSGSSERTPPAESRPREALGRLFEARAAGIAGARQVRQLDQKLERVSLQLGESRLYLQRFKLYPPYPLDEPRRAQTIREFNGLAEEIERLTRGGPPRNVALPRLAPTAAPADADMALGKIEYVRIQVETVRASLVAAVDSGDDAPAATRSAQIADALGDADPAGLSRSTADLLRQIS